MKQNKPNMSSKQLKIALIPFYFYPDISAIAQLFTDFVLKLAENKNYHFTVFSASCHYVKMDGRKAGQRIFPANVRLKEIKTTNLGKNNFLTRILDYLFYYIYVFFYFLCERRFDVIICLTLPPMLPYILALALTFKKTPFIYYIQDFYPELLYDLGYVRQGWLIKKLQRANQLAVNKARQIVVIGDYMKRKVMRNYRVKPGKISVIHNWTNILTREKSADKQPFTLLYSGNIGVPHDLSLLYDVIQLLKGEKSLFYRFVGGGKRKPDVMELFARAGEEKVSFENYAALDKVGGNFAGADILMIAQTPESVGDIVPSKFYAYLAAGRPVLFFGPRLSEVGEIITKNKIGVVCENREDCLAVRDYILLLMKNPGVKEETGLRARMLYEKEYNLDRSIEQFDAVIHRVAGQANNQFLKL